ncbi:phosphotransferase family protein [Falsirhodobacter xinxiangensis]|uniref:phosphotransferase family protein n=1 Tax=Falsirhodobacter xinxiangensis TaxID=2530049 RepID=UPI0010AAE076|nr:phosphotransferase [Rhodobacter xinxiangensis]
MIPTEPWRAAILARFPELAGARFKLRNGGWDCIALDVGDRMIFKFPRNPIAERRLRREAGLLAVLHARLPLPVPKMVLHLGPPVFSSHRKLPGDVLEPKDYARLDATAKARLALDLARFFAALHALDVTEMAANGAVPIEEGPDPALALPHLSHVSRLAAEALLRDPLPPDPFGDIYGFFDAHGWNMAFNHRLGVLNGIYDFADSGIGPLHREFVAPRFLGPDLVPHILRDYAAITGRQADPDRVHRITGRHRLQEIVETDDPEMRPRMIAAFDDWVMGK